MKETKIATINEQKKIPVIVLSEQNKVVYGD